MNIINDSPTIITLTKDSDYLYVADYGEKNKRFNSIFNILLAFDTPPTSVSVQSGCTCRAVTKLNKLGDTTYSLSVEWKKNSDAGRIIKDISIMTTEDGKRVKTTLRLTGNIN
jgi:hypothetical protein